LGFFAGAAREACKLEAHWASVELTSFGRPDDILATAASYDSTLRYGKKK
jgi:hypothetical protein